MRKTYSLRILVAVGAVASMFGIAAAAVDTSAAAASTVSRAAKPGRTSPKNTAAESSTPQKYVKKKYGSPRSEAVVWLRNSNGRSLRLTFRVPRRTGRKPAGWTETISKELEDAAKSMGIEHMDLRERLIAAQVPLSEIDGPSAMPGVTIEDLAQLMYASPAQWVKLAPLAKFVEGFYKEERISPGTNVFAVQLDLPNGDKLEVAAAALPGEAHSERVVHEALVHLRADPQNTVTLGFTPREPCRDPGRQCRDLLLTYHGTVIGSLGPFGTPAEKQATNNLVRKVYGESTSKRSGNPPANGSRGHPGSRGMRPSARLPITPSRPRVLPLPHAPRHRPNGPSTRPAPHRRAKPERPRKPERPGKERPRLPQPGRAPSHPRTRRVLPVTAPPPPLIHPGSPMVRPITAPSPPAPVAPLPRPLPTQPQPLPTQPGPAPTKSTPETGPPLDAPQPPGPPSRPSAPRPPTPKREPNPTQPHELPTTRPTEMPTRPREQPTTHPLQFPRPAPKEQPPLPPSTPSAAPQIGNPVTSATNNSTPTPAPHYVPPAIHIHNPADTPAGGGPGPAPSRGLPVRVPAQGQPAPLMRGAESRFAVAQPRGATPPWAIRPAEAVAGAIAEAMASTPRPPNDSPPQPPMMGGVASRFDVSQPSQASLGLAAAVGVAILVVAIVAAG
jgi:hypothetical protein